MESGTGMKLEGKPSVGLVYTGMRGFFPHVEPVLTDKRLESLLRGNLTLRPRVSERNGNG
jgi:hypothetical protein